MSLRIPPPVAASLLVLAGVLSAGCAADRMATVHNGGAAAAGWEADDQVAAMRAAGAGLYELEAARLAAARATSPQVRSYAQALVQQHGAAHAELSALLRARGLVPPAQLPPQWQLRLSQLAGSDAAGFDRHFLLLVGLEDHREQLVVHEHAARWTRDPALRAWFARSLPMLRDHLRQAHAMALGLPA